MLEDVSRIIGDSNTSSSYGNWLPKLCGESSMILPLLIQHVTTPIMACIGMGAVAAAVMSSADSSILSCATMLSRNIYKLVIRQSASEREVLIVLKIAVILAGAFATFLALTIPSIYALWFLSSDMVYQKFDL